MRDETKIVEHVVVYTTAREANSRVVEYLRRQGCNAVSLENPQGEAVFVHFPSRYVREGISPMAYIAVPPSQELYARRALQKFDEMRSRRFETICDTLRFQMAMASLVTLVAGVAAWMTYSSRDMLFPLLLGIWLGTFIFIAQVGRFHATVTRQRALNARQHRG